MSIVLLGSTSGSVTLQEPAIAGTTVLDLPAVSGTIITTGSSGQSIPKAALPTGSVLQVVAGTYATQTSTTSTSYVTTGITASITPTSSSSKVYVVISFCASTNAGGLSAYFTLYKGASEITSPQAMRYETPSGGGSTGTVISYVDSPATTSSTSYTVYMKAQSASVLVTSCLSSSPASITLLEIAA